MAVPLLATINVDVPEPRNRVDRATLLVDGLEWDPQNCINTFVDPVTQTGMRIPFPYLPAFYQGVDAANWPRLGLADFTLPTPSKWVLDNGFKFNGDAYLTNLNYPEKPYTVANYPVNAGWYLSWYSYNAGNTGATVALEFGQGEGTVADVRFRVYTDGKVEVWKNGVERQDGSITQIKENLPVLAGGPAGIPIGKAAYKYNPKPDVTANQTVDLYVIPCRHNSILLLSNLGGGFLVTFDDVDENDPAPAIIGAGKLWFYNPAGGQLKLQVAPMKYGVPNDPNCWLQSRVLTLSRAPTVSEVVTTTAYYDPLYSDTVETVTAQFLDVNGNPFVGNGSRTQGFVRVTLQSSAKRGTPFVYGARVTVPADIVVTGGPASNLDPWTKKAELNVTEDPAGTTCNLTLMNPLDVEASTNAKQISTQANRTYELRLTTEADKTTGPVIIRGTWAAPTWRDEIFDDLVEIMAEGYDRFKQYERYRFREPIPYNSMLFKDAWEDIAKCPGFGAADLDTAAVLTDWNGNPFKLPSVGAPSKGEWTLLPEVGDTAAEWLNRLWDSFARNLWYHWKPEITGPKFRLYDPNVVTDPIITIYESDAAAQAAGHTAGSYPAWYRSFKVRKIPPECNDLWITGIDRKSLLPISVHYADYRSQDPTLPPNVVPPNPTARPDNWMGEIIQAGLVEPAIDSLDLAQWIMRRIQTRLTTARYIGEWESEFLTKPDGSPVWRGDRVHLNGQGEFQVTTISGVFDFEVWTPLPSDPNPTDPAAFLQYPIRWFTYTGEYKGP